MSLNTLRHLSNAAKNIKTLPEWVSRKNMSFAAYQRINELKIERLQYISTHNKFKDYKKKSLYQISASEVARAIGAATTTLISTSAYSQNLKNYLDETNKFLNNNKESKLKTHIKNLGSGLKQQKKDVLLEKLQSTQEEFAALKKQNASDQVKIILNALSLPVKQKLGIN
jgi:ribosomal protein S20